MLEEPWTRVEPPTTLKTMLDAYERRIIASALAATAGNQRRAAASLGLLRRQALRETELVEAVQ